MGSGNVSFPRNTCSLQQEHTSRMKGRFSTLQLHTQIHGPLRIWLMAAAVLLGKLHDPETDNRSNATHHYVPSSNPTQDSICKNQLPYNCCTSSYDEMRLWFQFNSYWTDDPAILGSSFKSQKVVLMQMLR